MVQYTQLKLQRLSRLTLKVLKERLYLSFIKVILKNVENLVVVVKIILVKIKLRVDGILNNGFF